MANDLSELATNYLRLSSSDNREPPCSHCVSDHFEHRESKVWVPMPAGLTLNATTGSISGTPLAGSEQTPGDYTVTSIDGALSETFILSIEVVEPPVVAVPANGGSSYVGPVIVHLSRFSVSPGDSLAAFGERLESITKLEINGATVGYQDLTSNRFVFDVPLGLMPGKYDLVLYSSFGKITYQDAFEIGISASSIQPFFWTKRIGDSVKIVAKNIVGIGKVQFLLDGKEVAWIRAEDQEDPKLSATDNSQYLVRTKDLKLGKNRFQILLDGKRVWFATYSLKFD